MADFFQFLSEEDGLLYDLYGDPSLKSNPPDPVRLQQPTRDYNYTMDGMMNSVTEKARIQAKKIRKAMESNPLYANCAYYTAVFLLKLALFLVFSYGEKQGLSGDL